MSTLTAVLLAALAGIVNGSYAFPVKHMKSWGPQNIWLSFSIITFFIIPWAVLIYITPNLFSILQHTSSKTIAILAFSGFIFGIGMVLFTYSLRYVGMGIAFILNISIGTIFGSLVPSFILDRANLLSTFEILHYAALLLFTIGILLAAIAGYHRDYIKNQALNSNHKKTITGVLFGITSGLFTSMQGIAYAYAFPLMEKLHKTQGINLFDADNIPWIIIFSFALIPYAIYFLKLAVKLKSITEYTKKISIWYWMLILLMGCLYFSSLLFYTRSSELLGKLGPAIAWPIMMSFIILTSNFWSYIQKEWKGCPLKCHLLMTASIAAIILAVIFLGLDYYYFKLQP